MTEIWFNSKTPEHAWLSNFHPCPVPFAFGGKIFRFPSVEHAYQAAKCFTNDEGTIYPFLSGSAASAKALGRTLWKRPDWEQAKVPTMERLLDAKFSDRALGDRLVATGNARLIHRSPWDTFWGCDEAGHGQNVLGQLLERVRESLRDQKGPKKMNLMTELVYKVVLAGTGSRAMRVQLDRPSHPMHERARRAQQELTIVLGDAKSLYGERLVVLSGASEGLDEELAYAAFQLQIPYVLAIPSPGYGDYYWRRTSETKCDRKPEWEELLAHAHGVEYTSTDVLDLSPSALYGPSLLDPRQTLHVNFVRNERMVLLADAFVVYDGGSPGTKHCLEIIQAHGLPFTTLGDGLSRNPLTLPPCTYCGESGFVNRDGLCVECR